MESLEKAGGIAPADLGSKTESDARRDQFAGPQSVRRIVTRRFCARPSSVELSPSGLVSPMPIAVTPARAHALGGEIIHHGLGTTFRQLLVESFVADAVGVFIVDQDGVVFLKTWATTLRQQLRWCRYPTVVAVTESSGT